MKIIGFYMIFFMVILIAMTACKKDHPNKQPIIPVIDTIITLQNGGATTRLSFAPNTFLDIYFNSTINENRCPNCLTLGEAQCPYKGLADANFVVKNQDGDSVILNGVFKSCYAQNDTTQGKVNSASEFSPFNTYNIWPIALNPYPTDSVYVHYSLTLHIQYPAKL